MVVARDLRRLIPVLALAIAVVAAVDDRGSPVETALGFLPVLAFAVWALTPALPAAPLAIAVICSAAAARPAAS